MLYVCVRGVMDVVCSAFFANFHMCDIMLLLREVLNMLVKSKRAYVF